MILSKLRSLSFVMAFVITILFFEIFTATKAFAAGDETTPGYRLVNVYDAQSGVVTSKIYVTDGKAMVGMLGLKYDTELVSLVAKSDDGTFTTEYEELAAKGKISAFISNGSGVNIIDGTNNLSDLINEEKGDFFVELYYGMGAAVLDARENDVGLAVIRFKVNDGVTKEELEKCGKSIVAFAGETPSDPNVAGYNSGVYCANENNVAIRNSPNARRRITLYTEYQGLDIAGGFEVGFEETDDIRLIDRNTSTRIIVAPMGIKPADIGSMFTPAMNMSINIHDKHDNPAPDSITTGCYVKITKGNRTENIIIAVENDVDCDGRTSMSDLNALMRIMAGTLEDVSPAVVYTYDIDGDRQLSREEYLALVSAVLEAVGSVTGE